MSHTTTNIDQVENPNLDLIKKQLEQNNNSNESTDTEDGFKKGTNPLLWNAPVYSVIGIDKKNTNVENPNAYLARIAAEEEAKLNQNIK
jgi:hypothetical protein